MTGIGIINIIVDDINDNVFIFVNNMYLILIVEDVRTGIDVLLVNVSDVDVAVNVVIRFVY